MTNFSFRTSFYKIRNTPNLIYKVKLAASTYEMDSVSQRNPGTNYLFSVVHVVRATCSNCGLLEIVCEKRFTIA